MKIALIYFRENFTPAPPMGILYIATVLKQEGYQVIVLDSFPGLHDDNLKILFEFKPDLVGISVLTTGHQIAASYTREIKRMLPNSFICWGGVHPTSIPHYILENEKEVDFVVTGEGEKTMLEICERFSDSNNLQNLKGIEGVVYRVNGQIVENPKRDFIQNLDTLPIPDRNLIKTPKYSFYMAPPGIIRGQFFEGITTIYTSRGCPFHCIFCCSHETAGRKLRQRSVESVIEEIRYLKKKFHIKGLYFNDDTFGLDKDWTYRFCEKLKNEPYKLVWACQTRAHLVDRDYIRMLKTSGCIQVDIGCESGSDQVLNNLKKGIKVDHILNAFQYAKEEGLDTFATFILGNPGETLADIQKTAQVAKKINSRVSFLILMPYPGSELFEIAKKNDWLIDKCLHFSENWTNKQSEQPVMKINIESQDLVHIRAKLQNQYFWKNNLKIFLSILKNPKYFFYMGAVLVRYHKPLFEAFRELLRQGKTSVFLETVYQKYNEWLCVEKT